MKNVILIISDTFRYDNLHPVSDMNPITKNLENFASSQATEVMNMFMSSFPTIPHRTDVTSGRAGWPFYPWEHLQNTTKNHLPQMLKEYGYVSQLICDCPHLFGAGFHSGFDGAYHERGQEGDMPLLRMNNPIKPIIPMEKTRTHPSIFGHPIADIHRWTNNYPVCEEDTFASKTASNTVRWLEENYKFKPFFLWVDFFDPHEPWDPPEYLVEKYRDKYDGIPMIHPSYGKIDMYSDEELKDLRAHYMAESELVDRHIGRVLQKIEDLGLWENTYVIFTADHGHSIGEHDRAGKSNISDDDERYWPLYPEVAREPFLIAGPDIKPGTQINTLVQPHDIVPTIFELLDIDISPPESFTGHSFKSQLVDGDKTEIRQVAITAAHSDKLDYSQSNKSTTPSISDGRWALYPIGPYGDIELYDLDIDPLAENNIIDKNMDIARCLSKGFLDELITLGCEKEITSWEKILEKVLSN